MNPPSPRRDFFLGRTPADRAGDTRVEDAATEPAAEPYLLRLSRKAMAGEFEICLPMSTAGPATAAALRALDLIQALERQLSFFKPDSEISRINREAAAGAVEVEPRLFGLLQLAMRVWRESGGAYDLTATPLWEIWGFARRAGAIPTPEQIAEAQALVGGQWIELDERKSTIRFHRAGLRINLGSIGKGYAVDRAVESLLADGATDFLVHGGYSSVAARGSADGAAWKIGLKDPLREDARVGQIELHDRGLGTSGAQHQSFRHKGKRYGHILDPRTGWPAEGVLAATVVAPTAAAADALSTAFYVLGPQPALDYCRRRPEIAALLFAPAEGNRWELNNSGLELLAPCGPAA